MTSTYLIGLSLILSTALLMGQRTLRAPKPLQGAPAVIAGQKEKPENAAAIAEGIQGKNRSTGGTPSVKSSARPPDKDALLLAKFAKVAFDRRPSNILKNWIHREPTDKPKAHTQEDQKPGGGSTPVKKNPADIALEQLTLDVARGDWPAVGVFFHSQFQKPENALKAYGLMLDALARPPRVKLQPGAVVTPSNPKFAEKNFLSPADIVALADSCPGALHAKTLLPKLGTLLKAAVAAGHFPDVIVEILTAGSAKLGGTGDNDKRLNAARLLMASGLPSEAGVFLPKEAQQANPQALDLIASYHVAMHAKTMEKRHLSSAWQATQSALAHPEGSEDARESALARAVELVPQIEENLGKDWLGQSFTGNALRGREVLATIGALTSRGRAERASTQRLRRLTLQKTAVRALLESKEVQLKPWSKVLTLLALNWLGEGTLSYRYDTSKTLGPKMRWDRFGNMYYENPTTASKTVSSSTPAPIASGELLKVSPGEEWIALLEADLRPRFYTLYAQLYLKVNEPEKAFPYIEKISSSHPDAGKKLAEEFLRIWADNHDPNSGRNRSYKYGYMYGYNQRANSIPLTRSKQERNLSELAVWAEKLQSLPTGKLDQTKLSEAFTKIHSRAEVYKLGALNKIFGSFKNMEAKTVAAIASTMRTNLATVWRNPKTQQDLKTKRKDAEIMAEVTRGYDNAGSIVLDALQIHPENWRLWLVRACIALDLNNFSQENGNNSEFTIRRKEAFGMFSKAADFYAAALPESEADESTQVYEHWMYAALGASDLGALREKQQPSPAQIALIKEALEKLPDAASQRHMARFANALAARISAVKPELKQRYLKHGLAIVGKHEQAAEAHKVFDYYKDLVTEIQLVARIDGNPTVGHTEPFGVFVDIRHTTEIEREAGGFSKYLTNQNNASYAYNYGRPTQNYRDKFEETARSALSDHFEVSSVSFHDNKIASRGSGRPGWRTTPYAYLLLKARSPEVDKVPPLQIDLDFLDTSGFVILPVATSPLPIDAQPESGDPHQAKNLEIIQILDERKAQEGKIEVEVKATASGLIPSLQHLLNFPAQDFTLVESSGGDLAVQQLDAEAQTAAPISERTWMLTFTSGEAAIQPEEFIFPEPLIEDSDIVYQRYEDADLVATTKITPLNASYGETSHKLPLILGAGILLLCGFILMMFFGRKASGPGKTEPENRYTVPHELTPFTVIGLLHKMRDENSLAADIHPQLKQAIERLERYYFEQSEGDPPDLKALAEKWVALAA
ncbi:MAG: hypothetical protein GY899_02200 [Verrucomicrobiaceae bacterium]|nr:hypothetical protein [Verrucomicrobiaceae bacterium]